MAYNKNELILDKVRSLVAHDLSTGEMLFRLTSLEDPSLACTAEGEEVVDAVGALITTLYRAKKATFSASNSLISLDLAAAQFGTKKEIAAKGSEIIVPTYETIAVDGAKDITLKHTPEEGSITYIYAMENGEIATRFSKGAAASETEFVVSGSKITLPTSVTSGKVYVEYSYKSENANRIVNKTSEFPEACSMKIFAYFRDKCNENLVYSGVIVSPKAKLNPEQVELALTSTGKHAFEFQMMRDYCDDEAELFSIIIAE
jgi:hypothetical protein